jgi:hypothetical protein
VTRLERLVVLVTLLVVVGLFVLTHPVAGGFGALAGIAAGLLVADRFGRVRRKVDQRLGADLDVPATGLRVQVVVRRLLLQVAVLAVLLLVAAFTPLVGDSAVAFGAAGVTALPAVLAASRLRG